VNTHTIAENGGRLIRSLLETPFKSTIEHSLLPAAKFSACDAVS
jgi:hypothetical protein